MKKIKVKFKKVKAQVPELVESPFEKFDLFIFQEQQRHWQNRNFPNNESYFCLLGAMEELGEICHSHLKSLQKIRGSKQEHEAKIQDGIGDLIVYLAGYCNLKGYDLEHIIKTTWDQVKKRDWKKNKKNGKVKK